MTTRTLVCVLGETREHERTWSSFKKFVLDNLHADLALCIGVDSNYDFSNPFWQFARYKFSVPEYDDWGLAYEWAHSLLSESKANKSDWRILLNVGDQWLGGIKDDRQQPGSAGILLFLRWFLLRSLFSENLLSRYERVIVTRSDFIWRAPHPPIGELSPERIWVPDSEGYGGVTDRHAILSSSNIKNYLDVLTPVLLNPNQIKIEMSGHNNWNLERVLAHFSKRDSSCINFGYFPHPMFSVRSWGGQTRWSRGEWNDDLGAYIKYRNEFEMSDSISKIIFSNSDWEEVFKRSRKIGINCPVKTTGGEYIGFVGGKFVLSSSANDNLGGWFLTLDFRDTEGYLFLSNLVRGHLARKLISSAKIKFKDDDDLIIESSSISKLLAGIVEFDQGQYTTFSLDYYYLS